MTGSASRSDAAGGQRPERNSASRAPEGRLCVLAAALLWSLSGVLTRALQQPTPLGVDRPELGPAQIAFYRILFAGLFFLPLVRPSVVRFRPVMPAMVLTFGAMNLLFITAMARGTAANAIWLQYTAPVWMVLMAVAFLGESLDRRGVPVLALGMAGVGVILFGGWRVGPVEQLPVILMALGSGVTYAGVLVFLRVLRSESGLFLTAVNHLGGAACLLPFVWGSPVPTWGQLGYMAFFGVVQMGIPYWLMAKGLRSISPQEAGMLALLEPILNPVWAYLIAPDRETPPPETWVGAGLILLALVWRYRPARGQRSPLGSPISRT